MKKNIVLLFLFNFTVSNSQEFIESVINCSQNWANKRISYVTKKTTFDNHFKFDKSNTLIEVFNEDKRKLERLKLAQFKNSKFPATQLWLNYRIIYKNLILTELRFPYNLNCTTPWNTRNIEKILNPYLKVLQNKINIDLIEAIKIATEYGLNNIYFWDIDYEKRRLIWTLKSKMKDNKTKVIKINSKNGKVISEFIQIPID